MKNFLFPYFITILLIFTSSFSDSQAASFFSHTADFDSGWLTIAQSEAKTITHSLGGETDDYVVDLQFKYGSHINQRHYGGADLGTNPSPGHNVDDRVGAYWRSLTTSSIVVYRRPEDTYAEQVRIRIWKDSDPNWDSGWRSLTTSESTTLIHNLGGAPEDYIVDMQYRDSSNDVNQRYYGGSDFGTLSFGGTRDNERTSAYWRSLNNSNITVYRRPEDSYGVGVRIRIWTRPAPSYDSGWVSLSAGAAATTLAHNVGGNAAEYLVDMQYKNTGDGINQRYYGGTDLGALSFGGTRNNERIGAYWRSLNNSHVTVYRRPEDSYAEQVRIRIAHSPQPDFSLPSYDSGWTVINQNQPLQFTHNLGGNPDSYLVDLSFKDSSSNGVNQRSLGGMDHDANYPPVGNRTGAYWRSLTSNDIYVFRRAEDSYADRVRVRIWATPKPLYDSGWAVINQSQALQFTHNLGGNPDDYMVDLSFKDSSSNGVNQRSLGGMDHGADYPPVGNRTGAYWRSLTNNDIYVYRRAEDNYADTVRVRIWYKPSPSYDSGWTTINQSQALQFIHNLGLNPDDYQVELSFRDDSSSNGVNQRSLGGMDHGVNYPPIGNRTGAYWRSLSKNDIFVYRRAEDSYADEVRVRIWSYKPFPWVIFYPALLKH